ncbi:hypothetical protein NDU88_003445 [Pleurodeles waltl]|uniref:Uncharacterized protein n=1 Tax=Pleurodeles waltl TaxID=8319 RepID=A0AAV7WP38_PLEWA|nr:hypothetical protein NDU88_003445 [Pleurodeles waltl]
MIKPTTRCLATRNLAQPRSALHPVPVFCRCGPDSVPAAGSCHQRRSSLSLFPKAGKVFSGRSGAERINNAASPVPETSGVEGERGVFQEEWTDQRGVSQEERSGFACVGNVRSGRRAGESTPTRHLSFLSRRSNRVSPSFSHKYRRPGSRRSDLFKPEPLEQEVDFWEVPQKYSCL